MTAEAVRAAMALRFNTEWPVAFPAYDSFNEGIAEPDFSKQKKPFCFFRVDLPDVWQTGMDGDVAPARGRGSVEFVLFVREGQGTKPFFEMLDWVKTFFVAQVVSGIRLTAMTAKARTPQIGWQSRSARVDYNFDF